MLKKVMSLRVWGYCGIFSEKKALPVAKGLGSYNVTKREWTSDATSAVVSTINCPEPGGRLSPVPA